MTTNTPRPCQAKSPSECPYHGVALRVDAAALKATAAIIAGDTESYFKARDDLKEAALDKNSVTEFESGSDIPVAPEGAYYKYTGEKMTNADGVVLYQIKSTRGFSLAALKKGTIGGWVDPAPLADGTPRLSDGAWVGESAQLYGNARMSGNALLSGNSKVYDDAHIYGGAKIFGNAQVYENAQVNGGKVYGDAQVYGTAEISGYAQVYGNAQVYDAAKVDYGAQVYGHAKAYGNSSVSDNAKVYGKAEIYNFGAIGLGEEISGTTQLFVAMPVEEQEYYPDLAPTFPPFARWSSD